METSFNNAKTLAINEAKEKIKQGKLVVDDKRKEDNSVTLFILAIKYAQLVDDDFNNACDALYDVLINEFPDYYKSL